MKRIILIVLVILLMAAALGFYLWEIVTKGESDNLLSLLAVEFSLLATLVRLFKKERRVRRPLTFYEHHYAPELGRAFDNQPKNKKKLLAAIRLYNENKFDPSLDMLRELYRECRSTYDRQAVLMFTALCYNDSNRESSAIEYYEKILIENPDHSSALGKLAILCTECGKYTDAERLYLRVIDNSPEEGLGYHNLASLYYRMGDYSQAISLAHTALEKKQNFYQASALLSILYALCDDTKRSQQYFEQAVTHGQNAQNLRATIDRRLAEREEIRRYEQELAGRSLQFDGDIVITDPTYVVYNHEDWNKCEFGENLAALGIRTYLTFGHGDCVGTTVINTESDEIFGEFASDSCMVSVILMSELLAYNPQALEKTDPSCYTIIRNFHGTVSALAIPDDEDQYWKLVGNGNICFETCPD